MRGGYLQGGGIRDPKALPGALEDGFEAIRVGVHDGVEVVLGADWGGPVPSPAPRIAQVFTSTLALGMYGAAGEVDAACRPLLRAAYLGTLLAALDLGERRVVLTCIGGGVFGNPYGEIWDAIRWSLSEVDGLAAGPLDVVLNAWSGEGLPWREVEGEVRARGGVVARAEGDGLALR